jgi:hypothetical protein
MLKFLSDKEAHLALKMSFRREKNLSTAALEGTRVLYRYFTHKQIKAGSPEKKKMEIITAF